MAVLNVKIKNFTIFDRGGVSKQQEQVGVQVKKMEKKRIQEIK